MTDTMERSAAADALAPRAIGTSLDRLDGRAKVAGRAPYAYEHPVDNPAYLFAVQSRIALGVITAIDASAALALDGVLAVLSHENAPRVVSAEDADLAILQTNEVSYRGQYVAAVVAETPEIARQAAALVRVEYAVSAHDVELRADRGDLYKPEVVNPQFPTDTAEGDFETAFAAAPVQVDQTYTTARYHNNPMETHTTTAIRVGDELTLYDSTQGVHVVRQTIAPVLGLDPEKVQVICPHVGGGFGSKGEPHGHIVLAAMAAELVSPRPVKYALTRQEMFFLVGYRTPTIQRVRYGAETDGTLTAIAHEVIEQTSKIKEFAEQTAVSTRMMYAAPNRLTSHRLAALDVPAPSWMRAPGECPGMFATEVAMDELAAALGMDPVELRIRNDPAIDPDTGNPFSSRNLVACLREGARRFGWDARGESPGTRRDGRWRIGLGMASATYPVNRMPGSMAAIRYGVDRCYTVSIGAADLGTGARTALTQIAADALDVSTSDVRLELGSTALPMASVAGGSSGTNSWGSTIVTAARAFRDKHGSDPADGSEIQAETPENVYEDKLAMHAFGAQFAEVRIDADTGEIRVPRMVGIFGVGRIVNPRTARSQFIGGMTMGLSMALHENSVMDPLTGHVVTHDLADYHIASHADVPSIEVGWVDEHDPYVNPMGAKGIGEIGIVGAAAAIANAAYDATGVRVRDLPITADLFLG